LTVLLRRALLPLARLTFVSLGCFTTLRQDSRQLTPLIQDPGDGVTAQDAVAMGHLDRTPGETSPAAM